MTAEERRAAAERLRSICRDIEVRLAYNGPLEARTVPGPTPTGGRRARHPMTDAEVLRLRDAPTPPPGELRFADEQQLAHWKRDTICRRPEFRAATSTTGTPGTGTIGDRLRGICTKPTLGPDELHTLRTLYVEDPVAAERARVQRERERANLARPAPTPALPGWLQQLRLADVVMPSRVLRTPWWRGVKSRKFAIRRSP